MEEKGESRNRCFISREDIGWGRGNEGDTAIVRANVFFRASSTATVESSITRFENRAADKRENSECFESRAVDGPSAKEAGMAMNRIWTGYLTIQI